LTHTVGISPSSFCSLTNGEIGLKITHRKRVREVGQLLANLWRENISERYVAQLEMTR